MQAVCSTSALKGAAALPVRAAKPAAARSVRPVARVVCQQQQNVVKKAAVAATVALPSLATALPALALVDERLAGEGTGKIFGSSGPEGWAIFIVFGLIWAIFSTSAKGLGGAKDDDSGLSL